MKQKDSISVETRQAAEQVFFSSKEGSGQGTNILLVSRSGCVLYKKHKKAFDPNSKHILWSVTKSILSIVFGRAEYLKKISRQDLLSKFYPNFKHAYQDQLQLKHLLEMASGIRWNESYEKNPLESNVIEMLYGQGAIDMPAYVRAQGVERPPGTRWQYSSGESNLLMGALQEAFKKRGESFDQFLEKEVFAVLGIQDYSWEKDSSGNYIASSSLYLSAADLLKFGQLMLNEGRWNALPFLPSDWVSFSSALSPAFTRFDAKSKKRTAFGGAHWWVNRPFASSKIWPDADEKSYAALGHWGQILGVIPEKKIVFVRYANDRDSQLSLNSVFSVMEGF